jgi:NAD+ synthase (glutamine-hydrolysing)
MLTIVGAPIKIGGGLYNCAVCYQGGEIITVFTKTFLAEYEAFFEKRWFRSTYGLDTDEVRIGDEDIPLNCLVRLIDEKNGESIAVGAELCEDMYAPVPPSASMTAQGAQFIVNINACTEGYHKNAARKQNIIGLSERFACAYAAAGSGFGESTTDVVFGGETIICEAGAVLAEGEKYSLTGASCTADIDVDALDRDRQVYPRFTDTIPPEEIGGVVECLIEKRPADICRSVDPHPFLPKTGDGQDIAMIQAMALVKRMKHIGSENVVIGISGGLDSTLALLVCTTAFDIMGLPRTGIHGITMPGLGTSDNTKNLATDLMETLGITTKTISIAEATTQHLKDIGHDPSNMNVVYENAQARERTQVIMDYANMVNGLVIGTGDLSELALGWCTYNGDHMSMYGVNGSVTKTLVRFIVRGYANKLGGKAGEILDQILHNPISPELLPADKSGNITQKTEDIIGPYELHDFFLYHMMRYGRSPRDIYELAKIAFGEAAGNEPSVDTGLGTYDDATIKKWLVTFLRRFFVSQFKRSCSPDGPLVGPISLSPRGGLMMPSDACMTLWIKEAESL